jgi:cell division protein FtsQ
VNRHYANIPAARSWREIPQPVKPRAMSNGGRWRLVMAGVRTAALVALLGTFGAAAWMVMAALQEDPTRIPEAAKSVPVKPPELETMRDGVLDNAWLARTLELPPGVSLLELDLDSLRARVLADQQVLTAVLSKKFPDRLKVQITERMPVARVRVDLGVVERDLLVARDGVLFFGTGFDPAMLNTLPWLDGIAIAREGAGFRRIVHMDVVARLLADAQFSAPHLYHFWQSVSLARLESDRELEVVTKDGTKALFTAKGTFFLQLAKLNHVIGKLSPVPGTRARIDLTLGREVPVAIEAVADSSAAHPARAAPTLFPQLSRSYSKNNREL